MSESRTLASAKAHLSELVARVGAQHDRITVTVHGRPSVVLVSVDDLESLEETIAILSDSDAMQAIADSEAELARGATEGIDVLDAAMQRRRERETKRWVDPRDGGLIPYPPDPAWPQGRPCDV
jgi:antitoxin YefM